MLRATKEQKQRPVCPGTHAMRIHENHLSNRPISQMPQAAFPRISVIVPGYNVAHDIEPAIDTLLNQSKPFFEIIVVNDGSMDSTLARLRKSEAHARMHVIHSENQGLGAARNTGVAWAHGDFLYFFDAEGLLSPVFVETISAALAEDSTLDLIFFSGETFFDLGSEVSPDYNREIAGNFSSGMEAFSALLEVESFEPHAYMYVSRRCNWGLGKLKFPPIIHEDEAVILNVCIAANGTVVLPDKLYRRRIRANSIMTSPLGTGSMNGAFKAFIATAEVWRSRRDLRSTYGRQARRRLNILLEMYLDKCIQLQVFPKLFSVVSAYARLRWRPPLMAMVPSILPSWAIRFIHKIKG
jgi:glycosyltransferase involved in cell wall biosynthesis